MVLAAVVVVMGSFAPWALISFGAFSAAVNGMAQGGDGWRTLICGLIGALAGLSLLIRSLRPAAMLGLVAFVAVGLTAAAHLASLMQARSALGGLSAGPGLWVCLVGSTAGAIAAGIGACNLARGARRARPEPGSQPPEAGFRAPYPPNAGSAWQPGSGVGWQPESAPPPGWQPDPSGRYRARWFDGRGWTGWVSDGGGARFVGDVPQ